MNINIYKLPFGYFHSNQTDFDFSYRGYITTDTFDRDECWHLCNWVCWNSSKPENLYSDLTEVNSDVIFHDPIKNEYHIALSFGWHVEQSLEKMLDYCFSVKTK